MVIGSCLMASCNQSSAEYIDFLKVSDKTYVGVSAIDTGLSVPWDIEFNKVNNSLFITEIGGAISELNLSDNSRKLIYQVPNVYFKRTAGLLGMAIHPQFDKKPYVYIAYTTKEGEQIYSELAKLTYGDKKIVNSQILLKIEGANGHNGSRLAFDKKGFLYWATGDAHSKTHAQDSTTLNGKILRMTDEGKIPADNPIKDSYVYAWGFRNMQGLTFTANGNMMTSEHGDAIEDEVNWIRPLHNYGWLEIEGFHDLEREKAIAERSPRTEPIKAWTPVIAPAGLKYYAFNTIPEWDNSLLLVTLKSQSLRVLKLNTKQNEIVDEQIYFKDYYGRIRAVTTDNKGNIYLATSNRDWNPQNGFPKSQDDRILKLSKVNFVPEKYQEVYKSTKVDVKDGKALYQAYCESCHKTDGKGLKDYFPPLADNPTVGNTSKLVHTILHGLTGEITVNGNKYDQMMPSFNFLSNDEIAKISTYVRSNFGNTYSSIDSTIVLKSRK